MIDKSKTYAIKNLIHKMLLFTFIIPFLGGCARTIRSGKLMNISLGMDKQQILKQLGRPTIVRGSIKTKFEQVIEVWEYVVDVEWTGGQIAGATAFTILTFGLGAGVFWDETEAYYYWLYFHDNKLVKWGRAGDWAKEADHISEIRFR